MFPKRQHLQGGCHSVHPSTSANMLRLLPPPPPACGSLPSAAATCNVACGGFLAASAGPLLSAPWPLDPPTPGTPPCWLRRCHVQGIPPFLVHESPKGFLDCFPHLCGPFPGPLTPIIRGHFCQDAGHCLVVDEPVQEPRLPGPHHSCPQQGVKFPDRTVVKHLVTP
jgi:hypothetical protein